MTAEQLSELAEAARQHAYVPYSKFPVGAALECLDGTVFVGANVDNGSFGLTNCAERSALFSAVSAGFRRFRAIAIAGPAETVPPCGACRQVLAEFDPDDTLIVSFRHDGQLVSMQLGELLPVRFSY